MTYKNLYWQGQKRPFGGKTDKEESKKAEDVTAGEETLKDTTAGEGDKC